MVATGDSGNCFATYDQSAGELYVWTPGFSGSVWYAFVSASMIAMSGNGAYIATADSYGEVNVFSVAAGPNPIWNYHVTIANLRSLSISYAGDKVVIGTTNGMHLFVGGDVGAYPIPSTNLDVRVTVSNDGNTITACGLGDQRVYIFDGDLVLRHTYSFAQNILAYDAAKSASRFVALTNNGDIMGIDFTVLDAPFYNEVWMSYPSTPFGMTYFSLIISANGNYAYGSFLYTSMFGSYASLNFCYDVANGETIWTKQSYNFRGMTAVSNDGETGLLISQIGISCVSHESNRTTGTIPVGTVISSAMSGDGNTIVVIDSYGWLVYRPSMRMEPREEEVHACWSENVQTSLRLTIDGEPVTDAYFLITFSEPGFNYAATDLGNGNYALDIGVPKGEGDAAVTMDVFAYRDSYFGAAATYTLLIQDDMVLIMLYTISTQVDTDHYLLLDIQSSMESNFHDVNAAIADLSANLTSMRSYMEGQFNAITTSIASVQSGITALSSSMANLQVQMTAARAQLNSTISAVAAVQTSVSEVASSVAALQTSVAALQASLNTVAGNVLGLQSSMTQLNAQITALSSRSNSTDANVTALSGSVSSLQTSVTAMSATLGAVQTSVGQVQTTVNGMSSSINGASSNSQSASSMAMIAVIVAVVMGLAVIVVVFLRTKK
jgi:peptidoglycan hydrolase CwlO-like protein